MSYIEFFVAPVPNDKKDAYIASATKISALFKEHGVLAVAECWGTDVPDGELTSFPMAVKLEDGETVVTGFMRWPSKEARDKGMEAAMADPRMEETFKDIPMDGKRMIFGGFDVMLEV
ncbi:MAG: DUF1428 domain-containing protein [Pseudomonadota bacterium]